LIATVLLACLRSRPDLRYAVAYTALLVMALAPLATYVLIPPPVVIADAETAPMGEAVNPLGVRPSFAQTLAPNSSGETIPMADSSPRPGVGETETAVAQSDLQSPTPSDSRGFDEQLARYSAWLAPIWLVGVIVLALRQLAGWLLSQRMLATATPVSDRRLQDRVNVLLRSMGIRRAVRVVQSMIADVPMVLGTIRPVLIAPTSLVTGLSPDQWDAILAHELGHIRRYDYLLNLLLLAFETLLFYHPAVWWLSRQIRVEREHCCDDLAARVCGSPVALAEGLSAIEAARLQGGNTGLAVAATGWGRRGVTLRRVRRILGFSETRDRRNAPWLAGLLVLTVVLMGGGAIHLNGTLGGEVQAMEETSDGLEAVAEEAEEPAVKRAADLAPPVRITAGGQPIEVEGFAAPFVGDFDGDGKNDLLVGQYILGRLRIYRNVGTNARPKFDSFEWFKAGGRIAGVRPCCQIAFTPQLVDFNGNGRTDVLTGSGLTGELFLFRRRADQTFDEAEVLQNRESQVLMHRLSSRPRQYNVTALAYDWEKDGDADLLLGYSHLCLVLNEGTVREPSFDGGRLIECDGQPIIGGLGSPQMADWNGDGLDDLVAGLRRSVVWYRNIGQRGRPEFEAPRVLVPSRHVKTTDDQPGCHHAFCVADFNDDGRLDLLLGDRFRESIDEEDQRETSVADSDRRDALRKRYDDLRDEPDGETREERIGRYRRQLRAWQEYEALRLAASKADYRRRGNVWLYERIAPAER